MKKIKMIKASTYIFGILVCVFFLIVRENKKKDLEIHTTKNNAQNRIDQRDSLIGNLLKSESNKIDKINKSMLKIDSLKDLNKLHKTTITTEKKKLNETKYIICAPDSTIIRILSEHEFKTKGN
jgi:peptidoglycan hydrolase CwlO-like protein